MDSPDAAPVDPAETGIPRPAEVVQGIGPLFTPPYLYLLFPIVVVATLVLIPLLPVGGGGGPFAMLAPMLILFALALLGAIGSLCPVRLRIGNDGVQISWLTFARYISYRELAGVEIHRSARSRGVLFVTRKGARIPVPLHMHVATFGVKSENLQPILELLDRIGAYAVPIAARVEQERRTRAQQADGMAVVEDAARPSEERIAAARCLQPVDGAARERLRAFAAATADPALQRILEAHLQA